jgi:hypothetical protein
MPVRVPQLPGALPVPDDDPPDDPSSLDAPPPLDASVPWPLLPPGEDELDEPPPPGSPPPEPLPEEAPFDEPLLCAPLDVPPELPDEPSPPDVPEELVELLPAQCETRRMDTAAQARRIRERMDSRAQCLPAIAPNTSDTSMRPNRELCSRARALLSGGAFLQRQRISPDSLPLLKTQPVRPPSGGWGDRIARIAARSWRCTCTALRDWPGCKRFARPGKR